MVASVVVLLCTVLAVTDGDTVRVRCDGQDADVRVRLAEIDAPESGQPWGKLSRKALADLCAGERATVRVQAKDRYGRSVARVDCRGRDASTEQAAAGLAWAYMKYLTDPAIKRAEDEAHSAHKGLWADDNPVAPWEFRRRK